jgi:glutamyl-tRNA synthetase
MDEAERVARELAEEKGVKPGVIINGMRTVVTGQLAGPSMFDILMTLGREKVVRRLRDVDRFFQ